jgi:uncharacterized protein
LSDTIVLYHGPSCVDGFGSAFAAWKSLGDAATYLPVQYGDPVPDTPVGGTIYVLDFSYPRRELIALARRSSRVVVLDHHKSARDELAGLGNSIPGLGVTFDMTKSGAVLAWEYFHPGTPVPRLLNYVQDRDLWTWKLSGSREFSAALAIEPRDFKVWDNIASDTADPGLLVDFIRRGAAVLKYQKGLVDGLAAKAILVTVGDHAGIPAVNSPLFQSELGEELLKRFPESPFAACWFMKDEVIEVWSLRSRGDFDVSAVAKSLGGGGHPGAAGFPRGRRSP